MSNAVPCHRITAGGAPVVSSSRACSIRDYINVCRTGTQIPSPTPEGGKCIGPPRRELSHAHPMRRCQSGPADHPHLHLLLNEVAQNTQQRGARSHRCHHQGMPRWVHDGRRDGCAHVSRLAVGLRSRVQALRSASTSFPSFFWSRNSSLSFTFLKYHFF